MKPRSIALAVLACLAATMHTAHAQQLIADFESPTLTLPKIGDASQVDASFFFPEKAPPEGLQQLLLTTLSTSGDGGNFSGTDAVSIASLETFLSLQLGTIPSGGGLGDGSAVKLTLSLNAGDVVQFNYRFLTSAESGDGADFAFYTLQLGGNIPTLNAFADLARATNASGSALFNYESATGIVTLAPVDFSGTYTIGFGVVDHANDAVQSGVLVDNVQIVPEPSSALLVALSLAGLASKRRRQAVRG